MKRVKYILRGLFFILTVLLLSYLNSKTGVNLKSIAKFKLETLQKIQSDSLENKDKVMRLVHETTQLNKQISEDSSHAREAINYLILVVLLFCISELVFVVMKKRSFTDNN